MDESYSIVVAYADSEEQVIKYWPEANDIESESADGYFFSDRFPIPSWFEAKHEH